MRFAFTPLAAAPCVCLLMANAALADMIEQPRSIKSSPFNYTSFHLNSPSDEIPAPASLAPIEPTPATETAPAKEAAPAAVKAPAVEPAPVESAADAPLTPYIDCDDQGWGKPSCTPYRGDPCTLGSMLCGCDPWMEIGGWTQLGYHSAATPLSRAGNKLLSFNDAPDQLNLHQQWLYFQRAADGSCGLDWGFRFDVMYGTDAQKTQSFGNPGAGTADMGSWDASLDHGDYGWAMPQFYGEVAWGDWSVIAGHFYTLVGYEVVTAPDNFFYSHALTMFNSEPFTHTGMLATYSGLDGVELYGGWTLGWDTGFDQANGGSSFLGGFSGNITDDLSVTYITTIGNLGARSAGGSGYSHSLVFDCAVSCNLNYVLQTDYVNYTDNSGSGLNDDQVGINQYLFYTLNDCTALGARLEWWKTDGISFYEMTYGVNHRLSDNMVLRPEIRYDWTPTTGAYADGSNDQTTFGIDWILTY